MSGQNYLSVQTGDIKNELNATFYKRVCIKFVPDSNDSYLCSGCKCIKAYHDIYDTDEQTQNDDESMLPTRWDYKTCTIKTSTDAYGELVFPGSLFKSAKYIRVEIDTDVIDLVRLLYHSKGWNLQPPKLIISVTGGLDKFTLPHDARKAFKRGLAKAAGSTSTWIITSGTENRVMKLVDEAVAKERRKRGRDLVVLGIATWGVVALRDLMVVNQEPEDFDQPRSFRELKSQDNLIYSKENYEISDKSSFLCSNHNHFIFVDDGSQKAAGKEIELRARLESELSKGLSLEYYEKKRARKKKLMAAEDKAEISRKIAHKDPHTYLSFTSRIDGIPTILIVVQGGHGTLKTVYEHLIRKMPILILKGSKGCADLISNACSSESSSWFSTLIRSSGIIDKFKSDPMIYEEHMQESLQWLGFIVDQKASHLINFHELDKKDQSQDMEISILKALINAHPKKHFQNMRFALTWDRFDIAKMFILTGEEEFTFRELSYLMETALIENKPKFVEFILENGLNLRSFMTNARLKYLYNSPKMKVSIKKSPFFRILTRFLKTAHIGSIEIDDLRSMLRHYLLDDFVPEFLISVPQLFACAPPSDEDEDDQDEIELLENNTEIVLQAILEKRDGPPLGFPEMNLFLWALLTNRIEIARIFWLIGEHQVSTALFAHYLLKEMSKKAKDFEDELLEKAREFEDLACKIITSIDDITLDLINHAILVRKIPGYNLSCLELAVKAESLRFISLPTVQNLLNEIWIGNIEIEHDLKGSIKYFLSCASYGFLAPFLLKSKPSLPEMLEIVDEIGVEKTIEAFNYADNISEFEFDTQNKDTNDGNYFSYDRRHKLGYWARYKGFISSPKICFLFETIFFILFLCLFSFMLLCEFDFKESSDRPTTLTTSIILTTTSIFNPENLNETNRTNDFYIDKKSSNSNEFFPRNFPKLAECLLVIWIFSYFVDEIIQIIISKFKRTVKSRLAVYFSSNWNVLDILGCVVFAIGFTLRMVAYFKDNENIFIAARIVYAFDLSIWYLRLLHVSMVLKTLGPKLIMIRKMLYDLSFFIVILLIFVILFGVTTQATMYPGNSFNFELLKKIINKAYWPVYGDIRLLDELNIDEETCSAENTALCPSNMGTLYSYTLLILYMIFANVLLLNLLIAMFSFRFNVVQENTDLIWKFQLYELVYEYRDSFAFPPPISLISYAILGLTWLISKREKGVSNFYLIATSASKTLEYAASLERQFAEEFAATIKKTDDREAIDGRLRTANEKLEILEQKINEILKNQLDKKF